MVREECRLQAVERFGVDEVADGVVAGTEGSRLEVVAPGWVR